MDLAPHPEGGWYRETWRAFAPEGQRGASTAILYLLVAGQRSHWHRIDADEIWLWHGGDPLALMHAETDAGPTRRVLLGPALHHGAVLQHVIPAHHWQAAEPEAGQYGYALVSCVVAPAFRLENFELAQDGWAPGCERSPS